MNALSAYLEEETKIDFWRAYTAQVLWSIGKGLYEKYPIEQYVKCVFCEEKTKDSRSGREIVEKIRENLEKSIVLRSKEKGGEKNV